ncbi:MAG TPA: tRNA (guanosine(46)-N7)-methyltransferase TrmB [Planctomycetota bacterium]
MARPLSLALEAYLVDWQREPWPIDWERHFGRAAPLALEIGFGNGSFLEGEARAHPERDHVGIELSWTAATHLFRRLRRHELGNVRVLLGEAESLVRHAFAPDTLAEVFVNHPCPWPKARHHERRLLTHAFLGCLAERMQAGARLTVVTDHAEYAQWLGTELAAQPALASCHATVEVPALPGRAPTKYQLKAMAQGIPIHYFQWQKRGAPPDVPHAPSQPRPSELPMPTLSLRGARPESEPFGEFRPLAFREQVGGVEVVVKLEAVYRRTDRPVWLVETLVIEGTLRQQFGIDVIARGPTLLLKPSPLGQPYPTHGVKRAVWCVARWLAHRDPALTVEHDSLGLGEGREPWPA